MELVIEFYINNPALVLTVCGLVFFSIGYALALLMARRQYSKRVDGDHVSAPSSFAGISESDITRRQELSPLESKKTDIEAEVERRTTESERLTHALEAANSIAVAMGQSLCLEDIMSVALNAALRLFKAEAGGILILDPETRTLAHSVSHGLADEFRQRIDLVELPPDAMKNTGTANSLVIETIQTIPSIARLLVEANTPHSFAKVSLRPNDRLLGSLSIFVKHPRTLTTDDAQLLRIIGGQIAVTIDNARLFQASQDREREEAALGKVSQEILALMNIDQILDSVLGNAQRFVGTEVAALALVDEKSEEVFIRATKGATTEGFKTMRFPSGAGMAGVVIRTGQPLKIEDYTIASSISHEVDDVISNEGAKAFLAVPLKQGTKVVGVLYVLERHVHHFSDHDASLLENLANLATIAMENARLYEQVQKLAILSERGRIARQMHDGLAQVLGYLLMDSRSLTSQLAKGNITESLVKLEKMREIIGETYDDVRASIFGLRTSASLEKKSLMSGLADFLDDFGSHTGIKTDFVVESEGSISFFPSVETQLFGIVQEALANIRKHAQATRVWIKIERNGDLAKITIGDNGQGFTPALRLGNQVTGHFGLEIMRERAESVGGHLELKSSPGHGTEIMVRMPCALVPNQLMMLPITE